jgi:hypothetical protein
MHYIIGTSFSLNYRIGHAIKDRRFKPGIIYKLINLSKKEDKFFYKFIGSDQSIIELEFSSCREGDKFISSLRNEKLPEYDKVEDISNVSIED